MVIWSIPAKDDLKKIYDYIDRDSKFYATKVSQEFVEKSEGLGKFPKMGRIVPEIGNLNIRELIIYSYRLVYEISSIINVKLFHNHHLYWPDLDIDLSTEILDNPEKYPLTYK